jgi:hypothetical protein
MTNRKRTNNDIKTPHSASYSGMFRKYARIEAYKFKLCENTFSIGKIES